MPKSSMSEAVYVREPVKAAHVHAQRRALIARLEQEDTPRAARQLEEQLRMYNRVDQAFRDVGRCSECGRELSDPVSVARGIGGDCWRDLVDLAHEEFRTRVMPFQRRAVVDDGEAF